MKKYKLPLLLTVFCAAFAALVWQNAPVTEGVKSGLRLVLSVTVPALLPTMTLCAVLARSGAAAWLSSRIGAVAAVTLTAMTGGYPAGAVCARELLRQGVIDSRQAARLSATAISAGPAFVLIAVGRGMLGSPEAGSLLLFCNLLATVIVTLLFSRQKARRRSDIFVASRISDALVQGVADSTSAMMNICVYTLLFSALGAVLEPTAARFLQPLLEITGGIDWLCRNRVPLPVLAAALGFSGAAVLLQILALSGAARPTLKRLLSVRVIHAAISYLLCDLLLRLFPFAIPAAIYSGGSAIPSYTTIPVSAALLLLCVVFLCSLSAPPRRLPKIFTF